MHHIQRSGETIPHEVRERAGLLPHTEVDFELDGKIMRLLPAGNHKRTGRGARFVAHLRGRGDVAISTDAIMAIDQGRRVTPILVDSNPSRCPP
jgi:hypothetical protein